MFIKFLKHIIIKKNLYLNLYSYTYKNIVNFLPFCLKINKKNNYIYLQNILDNKYIIMNFLKLCHNNNKIYKIFFKLVDLNKDGYRVFFKDNFLVFKLGFSHPIKILINIFISFIIGKKGKSIKIKSKNFLIIKNYLFIIKNLRLPETHKGKGLLYNYEKIKLRKINNRRHPKPNKNFKKKRKK